MTAVPKPGPELFLPRPPLDKAIDLANRDLRRGVSTSELHWLHEHPVTWLQALVRLELEVQSHLAKNRLSLAGLRPVAGEPASPAYLAAKRAADGRQLRSLHYLQQVQRRRAEVASLFGYENRTFCSDGALLTALAKIENLLELGDSDAAADILAALLDSLEATAHRLRASERTSERTLESQPTCGFSVDS